MGFQIFSVKLLLLTFILSSSLVAVYGIRCYECMGRNSDGSLEACEKQIGTNQTKVCSQLQPYCIKAYGKLGNETEILRLCGEHIWESRLGGTNLCKSTDDIERPPGAANSNKDKKLDDGTVCICTTDGCNPAGRFVPAKIYALIPIFIAVLISPRIFV